MEENSLLEKKGNASQKHDKTGRFVKGHSGNPKGRPVGRVNQAFLAMRKIVLEDAIPQLQEAVQNGKRWAILAALEYGLPKMKPLSIDPEMLSEKAQQLIDAYLQGEHSLKETALLMDRQGIPLPDSIRILLAKEEPEPEDPSKGQYCVYDDEKMEALSRERLAKIQTEKDNLPERKAEMQKLYGEMEHRDAFSTQASPKDSSKEI